MNGPECKKTKKDTLDARNLNEVTQSSLEEVSSIQKDLEQVSKRMNEKIFSIVEEFASVKKPLYTRRHGILKSVPHFWAISFMNHPKLKLLLNNCIEDCFHYLQSIQVLEDDVKSGFSICFHFASNPYFYDTKLIKNYASDDENGYSIKKTNVEWKEKMNLSSDSKKLPSGERKRLHGPPVENFFDWLQRSGGENDLVCDIIRDDLWIDPLKYFFAADEPANDDSDSDSEDNDDIEDLFDSKDEDSEEAPEDDVESKEN